MLTNNSRTVGILIGVLICVGGGIFLVGWSGCRSNPHVSSKESLELVKLLYTACNTQDQTRLRKVEKGLEKLAEEGKMPPKEQQSYQKIIELAKSGRWQEAEKRAYRFAKDQTR